MSKNHRKKPRNNKTLTTVSSLSRPTGPGKSGGRTLETSSFFFSLSLLPGLIPENRHHLPHRAHAAATQDLSSPQERSLSPATATQPKHNNRQTHQPHADLCRTAFFVVYGVTNQLSFSGEIIGSALWLWLCPLPLLWANCCGQQHRPWPPVPVQSPLSTTIRGGPLTYMHHSHTEEQPSPHQLS